MKYRRFNSFTRESEKRIAYGTYYMHHLERVNSWVMWHNDFLPIHSIPNATRRPHIGDHVQTRIDKE